MRITLHFQKTQIVSKYSTYWLEVYDGHTDKNPLIANYTFENGKTPESIFSRSNYLFVKLRFQCNYPTDRRLQPVELGRLGFKKDWDVFNSQRYLYEKQLLRNNQPPIREDLYVNERAERPWQEMPFHNVPPLFLSQLEPKDRANEQLKYERVQKEENIRFQNEVRKQLLINTLCLKIIFLKIPIITFKRSIRKTWNSLKPKSHVHTQHTTKSQCTQW